MSGGTTSGTATVLFTDLVGSTEGRARVGEEEAKALRRTHDRLLAPGGRTCRLARRAPMTAAVAGGGGCHGAASRRQEGAGPDVGA